MSQDRYQLLLRGLFWGLLVLYAGYVFFQPAIPSSDGPVHAYYGEILADQLLGGQVYTDFRIRQYLPPYALANYFLAFTGIIFPGVIPEKLLFALCVVVFCTGFRSLVTAMVDRETWAILLAFPFAFHRYLFHGFYSFSIGAGLLLWAAAFWLRNSERMNGRRSALFVLLLAGLYFAHPMTLAAALLFFGLHTILSILTTPVEGTGNLYRGPWLSIRAHRLQILHVSLGLAPAYLVARYMNSGAPESQPIDFGMIVTAAGNLWRMSTLMPHDTLPGWIARLLIAVSAIALAVYGPHRSRGAGKQVSAGFVLGFGLLFFLIYAIAPDSMNGSPFFGERFALFAIVFLAASGSVCEMPPETGWKAAAALGFLAVVIFVDDVTFHRRLAHMNHVLLEAPRLERGSQGAVLMDGWGRWEYPRARYSPCAWASATHFRRSEAAMLNTPWFNLSFWMLKTSEHRDYYGKEHTQMAQQFRQGLQEPPEAVLPETLDVLLRAHCSGHEQNDEVLRKAAARYGLQLMPWSTHEYTFYVRPGALRNPPAD